jgi:hypothetical protein
MKITKDQLREWAGWGIEAGEGWACFAGLSVRVLNWATSAKVVANVKPRNLFGGHWVGDDQ